MSINIIDWSPGSNSYNTFYPSISLKNPSFTIKHNNNNDVNKYQMNLSNKNFIKSNSKSTSNFFSAAETHRRNVSSNIILKKPDNRVLSKIDKLYSDLKKKEEKLENIIEPFLSRNRIRIKKENIYLGHMRNLKNSVEKKEQDKDASFVKINIYNSFNNDNNNDEDDLSPNVNEIFSNKLILNNINEHNFIRNGNNQKIILLPNSDKKFGFFSSKGSNTKKINFKSFNTSNNRGKFFHKEIKIVNNTNKNQITQLDTNSSNNINNLNCNRNNINNLFNNQTSNYNVNNPSQSNFNSSLKNGKFKVNSLNFKDCSIIENAHEYNASNCKNVIYYSSNPNLNVDSKKHSDSEKQDELKSFNLPKRRNLSDIPSSTSKCKLTKFSNEQGDDKTGQETIKSEEQENAELTQAKKISEKMESLGSAAEESDNVNSFENNSNKDKIDCNGTIENVIKDKNNKEESLKQMHVKSQNISVSVSVANSTHTSKNKEDLLDFCKSPKNKNYNKYIDRNVYANSDIITKHNSSCTKFYSIKNKIGDESAKEKFNTRHHFYSNKAATNNLNDCSPPSEEGKKNSNMSWNVNWRSKSQSKITPFEHFNQEIENIYDIKIDAKYDKAFDSKMAKIDEELKENKYSDNIKFNYMVKNFNRFKDFIQKPTVVIKPAKTNPIPQQIFNNELKVGILKKLKNAMLKKEIQKKNLY